MTAAHVPKYFPRTRLASGRVLSGAQQHQYDVLRTVGGKLVNNRNTWYRADTDARIYGLNLTAMWKLVEFGLAECGDAPGGGYLFLLPALAKGIPGRRYVQTNHRVREKTSL